jgi:hypothetical protein
MKGGSFGISKQHSAKRVFIKSDEMTERAPPPFIVDEHAWKKGEIELTCKIIKTITHFPLFFSHFIINSF